MNAWECLAAIAGLGVFTLMRWCEHREVMAALAPYSEWQVTEEKPVRYDVDRLRDAAQGKGL